jgi:hypothetical protein
MKIKSVLRKEKNKCMNRIIDISIFLLNKKTSGDIPAAS